MDVHMPEMDGIEATARIRAAEVSTNQHVPIVAVTACAMAGDRETCIDAGFDAYLAKPLAFDALDRVLVQFAPSERFKASPVSTAPARRTGR